MSVSAPTVQGSNFMIISSCVAAMQHILLFYIEPYGDFYTNKKNGVNDHSCLLYIV